ncbi:MAG: hypothetical protein RSD49_06780 [Hafnia sp.]
MGIKISDLEKMAKNRDFEASDELESWLARLSASERSKLQLAMDVAYEQGYQQAEADSDVAE